MIYPSKKEFLEFSKKGNLIPVYKEILGDLETPVSAYYKIVGKAKYSFLLESVEGEEKVARISFLAKDPELVMEIKNNTAKITRFDKNKPRVETVNFDKDPLRVIRSIMKGYKFVNLPGLPSFCGGMVGFFSYDIVRFFEKLPRIAKDDLKFPDGIFVLSKDFIVFDHPARTIKIINCVSLDKGDTAKKILQKYAKAINKIEKTGTLMNSPFVYRGKKKESGKKTFFKVESNISKKDYEDIVRKGKKQISDGEIIQVVLSQRFQVKLQTEPFNIYRALRTLNPSPYMYYLNFDKIKIVGSSPEMFVRCEHRIVETRPIAGTRPRGKDEEHDDILVKELLADPKEKAEHIMLVDLGRNDLGRICEKNSIEVSEFMKVEKYSHVMHIVSNVRGRLKKGKSVYDVLPATFPAGTLSGAPKVRAMEIIEDLEKNARGTYAGCIGYLSFSGNLNTCITIRTMAVKNNIAYIQAGAGIVADSKPAKEYQETVNKAKAQIKAIELANKQ